MKAEPKAASPPRCPELDEYPPYAAATENLGRLNRELTVTEEKLDSSRQRLRFLKDRERRVEMILAGENPESDPSILERTVDQLHRHRRDLSRAIDLAKKQVSMEQSQAKSALLKSPFFTEVYRPATRKAALAFLSMAKVMSEYDRLTDDLNAREMNPGFSMPRSPWGDIAEPSSWANTLLGLLIDEGILSATDDAEALEGTHPQTAPSPSPPAPASPPKAKRPDSGLSRILRSAGVAMPR